MRTSITVAVLITLGVAAGGAWYGLQVFPQQSFRSGLDQALATLPPGTTATYKTARYSVLTHQAVVTGVAVHGEIAGAPPRPFDITVDSIEADNPNLDFAANWSRAVANPAAFGPDTALAFADAIALKGVALHSAAVNMTEESARTTKLRLYPWALLHDGMPSWNELQASLVPSSRPVEMADLRPILRAEAAVALGVGYDTYEAGAMKSAEAPPGAEIAYDIRKMTSGAFDRGIMQGAAGEGITLNGDSIGTFTVDRIAMGPIDMRETMTRLVNGEALSPALLEKLTIGRIAYDGITARRTGGPTTHMGGFSIGPMVFVQGIPVSGQLAWTDLTVSKMLSADPQVRDGFDKLGLEQVTMSFALAYDLDIVQKHASMHDTILKVNELGTVTIAADFANVLPNADGWKAARLAHARLRFEDASMVDRMVRAGAAETGSDPDAYRRQVAGMVRQQSQVNGGGGPVLEAAGRAVSDFIVSAGSLTVELAPPTPVPLMALLSAAATPGRAAAMFGLTASVNKK